MEGTRKAVEMENVQGKLGLKLSKPAGKTLSQSNTWKCSQLNIYTWNIMKWNEMSR